MVCLESAAHMFHSFVSVHGTKSNSASAATPTASPRPVRLPALQILRFVAAFLVVLFHVGSGLSVETGRASNPFHDGVIGVDIFFVLSGFIIAYTAEPARGMGHFALRRAARVVPLYWLLTTGVIFVALAAPTLVNGTTVSAEKIIRSYLFIPYQKDNGLIQPLLFLGWTLCFEMYFYALFCLCLTAGRYAVWLSCALLSLIVLVGWIRPEGEVLWRFYTSPLILEFAFGLLLSQVYASRLPFERRGTALAALLASGALLLYLLDPDLPSVIKHGFVATLIVASFLSLPPLSGRWVAILVLLGDASYALYLSHPYFVQASIKIAAPRVGVDLALLAVVFGVGLAIAIAVLLHRLVERPAQSFIIKQFARMQTA
ncbi:acyltransferase [Methylobacterium sp. NMS14P]|uniref:acyltransferase family protein n=1 Tax=Methylobacterium sp. NMS14P TaxID=2894310 RepID=UPI002359BF2D|nr:acyltransferase [Methylobacterium sp. NMS14P]WCS24878.1 acyltransferase [Methylobacterium sp. NMS14P]